MLRSPATAGTCSGPGCSRHVYARGLCEGHWTQRHRGKALSPLREGNRVPVSIRVSPDTAARVAEDRDGARAALEKWAGR